MLSSKNIALKRYLQIRSTAPSKYYFSRENSQFLVGSSEEEACVIVKSMAKQQGSCLENYSSSSVLPTILFSNPKIGEFECSF